MEILARMRRHQYTTSMALPAARNDVTILQNKARVSFTH